MGPLGLPGDDPWPATSLQSAVLRSGWYDANSVAYSAHVAQSKVELGGTQQRLALIGGNAEAWTTAKEGAPALSDGAAETPSKPTDDRLLPSEAYRGLRTLLGT